MKFKYLAVLVFFVASAFGAARAQNVKGVVYGADTDEPLIGASVYWAGTTVGTGADAEGNYTIHRVKGYDMLVAGFVGYTSDTIRVESGKLGKFDPQCVGSIVRVKGILREQRVDDDYLRSWEEQVRTQAGEQHGTTAAGCDSEKKARGETAATVEGRIADFRRKIAERNAAEGNPYLSFYFVEAQSYEFDR